MNPVLIPRLNPSFGQDPTDPGRDTFPSPTGRQDDDPHVTSREPGGPEDSQISMTLGVRTVETSPSTRSESENNHGVAQTAVNRKAAAISPRAGRSETVLRPPEELDRR